MPNLRRKIGNKTANEMISAIWLVDLYGAMYFSSTPRLPRNCPDSV